MTRVVSELRHSIFDLRTRSPPGRARRGLSDYADPGQRASGDDRAPHARREGPRDCRADVEYELLRIAQEAITNARKHSGAAQPLGPLPHPLAVRRDQGAGRRRGTGTRAEADSTG